MKPVILISVITYAMLSAYAYAECDQETVEQQLRAADFEYDVTAPLVWEFPTPTHLLQLQIDRDDGDMTLPGHVAAQVGGQLPCVAVDRNGEIEIVIGREALRGCEGDFSVFEHLLEQTVRALHAEPAPDTEDGSAA